MVTINPAATHPQACCISQRKVSVSVSGGYQYQSAESKSYSLTRLPPFASKPDHLGSLTFVLFFLSQASLSSGQIHSLNHLFCQKI